MQGASSDVGARARAYSASAPSDTQLLRLPLSFLCQPSQMLSTYRPLRATLHTKSFSSSDVGQTGAASGPHRDMHSRNVAARPTNL